MAVKIRMKRLGSKKKPFYRLVVMEASRPRDGETVEVIGVYNPCVTPKQIDIKKDRAEYWLSVGAQPTDSVHRLFSEEGLLEKRKRQSQQQNMSKKVRREGPQEEEAPAAAPAAEAPASEEAPAEEAKAEPVAEEPKAEAESVEEKE